MNHPSTDSPESNFWCWFSENCTRFSPTGSDCEESFQELGDKLTEYHDGLVFEVTVQQDGVQELVISADGVRENFPAVHKLTEFAPVTPGWRVTAFRPRMDNFMDCTCNYEGREFDPNLIWFYACVEGEELDFIFYHPDYSEDDRTLIACGTYILLDMAIGERDVVCGIRHIDHQSLPEDPAAEELIPFSEFRDFFDANRKRN